MVLLENEDDDDDDDDGRELMVRFELGRDDLLERERSWASRRQLP